MIAFGATIRSDHSCWCTATLASRSGTSVTMSGASLC